MKTKIINVDVEQEVMSHSKLMSLLVKKLRAKICNFRVTIFQKDSSTIEINIPDDLELRGINKMYRDSLKELIGDIDESK